MESLKEKSIFLIQVKTPGVGSYLMPSEFGIYESAKK
jgi:hypothetical protein